MDKNEDRDESEEITKAIEQPRRAFQTLSKLEIPVDKEYSESLEYFIRDTEGRYRYMVGKLSIEKKALFANKKTLTHIGEVMSLTSDTHDLALRALYAVDFLTRKIDLLENALATINDKVKDLPTADKLRELANIPKEMANMGEILGKLQSQLLTTQDSPVQEQPQKQAQKQETGQKDAYVT